MTIISLVDERQTSSSAAFLAGEAQPGDLILLRGDLGMGKTTFARAFIRERAGASIDVPSPTFSLIESYALGVPVHHVDLYRLDDAEQIVELGLDDLYDDGIVLIEWPERAEGALPMASLDITFQVANEQGRLAKFQTAGSRWKEALSVLSKEQGQ